MRKYYILYCIFAWSLFSIFSSCNSKNGTTGTESVKEVEVSDDEFDDSHEKDVTKNPKSPVYKFLHEGRKGHTAKMRRYMKEDEMSVKIKTRVDSVWFLGKKPPYKTVRKDLAIYHDGSVQDVEVVDSVTKWIGSGDVWIIYYSVDAIRYNDFYIKGRAQEAFHFPQKTHKKKLKTK